MEEMTNAPAGAPGWYVVSLRPRGEHGGVHAAAARVGAGVVELSPWAIVPRTDAATRAALDAALACPRVVATSPAAVRAAAGLQPLAQAGRTWIAVGGGTAQLLRMAGVDDARVPARMDSEGVLALDVLRGPGAVGLVTAPGGRDLLAPMLATRGLPVHRADVYDRVPVALEPAALAALRALPVPFTTLASSTGALQRVLDGVDDALARRLRAAPLVVASARMSVDARLRGFAHVHVAEGPRPAMLVARAAQGR